MRINKTPVIKSSLFLDLGCCSKWLSCAVIYVLHKRAPPPPPSPKRPKKRSWLVGFAVQRPLYLPLPHNPQNPQVHNAQEPFLWCSTVFTEVHKCIVNEGAVCTQMELTYSSSCWSSGVVQWIIRNHITGNPCLLRSGNFIKLFLTIYIICTEGTWDKIYMNEFLRTHKFIY